MVLKHFIYFLPCFVTLLASLLLLCRRNRSNRQGWLLGVFLLLAFYSYVDANYYIVRDTYRTMVWLDISAVVASLLVFPLEVSYVLTLSGRRYSPSVVVLACIPAFLIGGALATCVAILGLNEAADFYRATYELPYADIVIPSNVHRIYFLIDEVVYPVVMAIEVIVTMVFMGVILRLNSTKNHTLLRFLKGEGIPAFNFITSYILAASLLYVIKDVLGYKFLIDNPLILCAIHLCVSVLLAKVAYAGIFFEFHPVPFTLFSIPLYPDSKGVDSAIPAVEPQDSGAFEAAEMAGYNNFQTRFADYVADKKPYLNANLTIEDVARDLDTNRTYISIYINQYFDLPFRTYINNLRIDYAKSQMQASPGKQLDDIARESGFLSLAQFSRKFKETEGSTPSDWRNSHLV